MKRNLRRRSDGGRGRYATLWHVVSIVLALGIASFLVVVEPFNLDQGLSERGRILFYKVAGFAYPRNTAPKVAVVVIDTKFVTDRGLAWPMSYNMHRQVLEEIDKREPRAIFIDMPFAWDRKDPGLEDLKTSILAIAAKRPVYIAAAAKKDGLGSAIPDILALADSTEGRVKFVSIRAGSPVGGGDAYPVDAADGLLPAAVQIYNDQNRERPVVLRHDGDQMDIWWAAPRSEFNCRGDQQEACGYLHQGPVRRFFFVAVSGFLPQPPGVRNDPTIVPIPYAPTLRAEDLFSGDAHDTVAGALNAATVFYGANVALSGDTTQSVVQGDLPGVHAHAMAFDNLVKFGGKYLSAGAPFGMGNKLHNLIWLALIAAAALAFRLAATLRWPILARQPHMRGGYFSALDAGAGLAVGVVLALVEFKIWRVGPGAWATVLVAALGGSALSTRAFTGWLVLVLTGRLDVPRRVQRSRRARNRKNGVKWPLTRP